MSRHPFSTRRFTRRQALRTAAATGAAAAAAPLFGSSLARAAVPTVDPDGGPRFLIVLAAAGGGSIIDSALALRESEVPGGGGLNCFPDAHVKSIDGTDIRAVDFDSPAMGPIPQAFSTNQSAFVSKHHDNMMVSTWTRTSVNHEVGQSRSVTGNDAWAGRTLQEVVAAAYGESYALPNVHLMSGSGFTRRGLDASLPTYAFGEQVADPRFWPLSLDGTKGVVGAPARSLVTSARGLRERLEKRSAFLRTFAGSKRLQHWQHLRSGPQVAIEAEGLIDKLIVAKDGEAFPLDKHGLAAAPEAEALLEAFPNASFDPFEAQAALAFLLLKNRLSVSVTLGPSFNVAIREGVDFELGGGALLGAGDGGPQLPPDSITNPPIAFDFSHQAHRSVQGFMWTRLYSVMDRLIGLLAGEEYANGESLWDRTLIYVASDFGRTRTRPAGAEAFGTSHDLNNGVMALSPLVNGNTILGGVDPATTLTYGFDPNTGTPDPGRNMEEREIYAGLLQALGIDTSEAGLPNMPAMRRS